MFGAQGRERNGRTGSREVGPRYLVTGWTGERKDIGRLFGEMTGLQGCKEGGRDYKRRVNWGATGWREGNKGFGLCNGRLRRLWGSPVRTLERGEAAAALPSFSPRIKAVPSERPSKVLVGPANSLPVPTQRHSTPNTHASTHAPTHTHWFPPLRNHACESCCRK